MLQEDTLQFHSAVHRPAIHSDFIWIIQIFLLKFSETDNLTQNSDFLALNTVEISI